MWCGQGFRPYPAHAMNLRPARTYLLRARARATLWVAAVRPRRCGGMEPFVEPPDGSDQGLAGRLGDAESAWIGRSGANGKTRAANAPTRQPGGHGSTSPTLPPLGS